MSQARPFTLSWAQTLGLAAPTFAFTGYQLSLGAFLPSFLSQHLNVVLGTLAALLFAVHAWETLSAPLISVLSDGARFAVGRRRTWMLIGAPLVLLATSFVYFARADAPLWAVAAALGLLCTGWTLINAPHGAWALEISSNPQERARIFAVRAFAGYLAAPAFILAPALAEHLRLSDVIGWQTGLIGGLILISLPAGLLWLRIVPERAASPSPIDWKTLVNGYVLALRQRRYWPLAGLFACLGAYNAIETGLYLFLMRVGLGLPNWGAGLMLAQSLLGFAGIPIFLSLQRRFGAVTTLTLIVGLQLLGGVGLWFLPYGQLIPAAILSVLRGLATGAEFVLLRALLGELLDAHAERATDRPGGAYYSSFHFMLNVAGALATFMVFKSLQGLGFDPKSTTAAGADSTFMIRAVVVGGETIVSILSLVLLQAVMAGRRLPRLRRPRALRGQA